MEMYVVYTALLALVFACKVTGKTYLNEPNVYYECEKNNTIVINVKNVSYGSVHAVATTTKGNNSTCSVQRNDITSVTCVICVTFTITNCIGTSTITVHMVEEKQDKNNTALDGKGLVRYELKCNNVQKRETNVAQDFNLTHSDSATSQHQLLKDVNLTLEVKDRNNQTLNSNSEVMIGDELHLIVSGNYGFKFAVQSCKATDAAIIRHEKNLTHDGLTYDPSLMSNFSHQQNYSGHAGREKIEATLYAFQLMGSKSIVITCTITFCESDDDACPIKQTEGRRRRGFFPVPNNRPRPLVTFQMPLNVGDDLLYYETSGGSRMGLIPILICVLFCIFEFHV